MPAQAVAAAKIVYNNIPKLKASSAEKARAAVRKATTDCQAHARAAAPVKYSTLRNSIDQRILNDGMTGEVGTNLNYAAVQEFGSGSFSEYPGAKKQRIIIKPKTKKALAWPGAAHPVKKVKHPGVKGKPYLRPAAKKVEGPFISAMEAIVKL